MIVYDASAYFLNGYRRRGCGWFDSQGYTEIHWLEITPDDYARHWDLEGPHA